MEEERIELAELDTIETEDVQEDAEETLAEEAKPALEPEAAARRLFASYLEPSEDKPEQEEEKPDDLPEPVDEVVAALPVDGADLIVLVDEQESEDESAPAEGTAPDGDASADDDDGDEPSEGGRNWYVIHSYSGYENKVKKNLEHRIESLGMQHKIFEVVVPTEEEIELKDGQRRTVERRIFPGYILVDMLMDEDSWYVVRNTPGVTGFVGSVRKPTPLRQRDVDKILKRMRAETPRVTVTFVPGQKVRIADGPFEDFVGAVDEIFADKGKVRILVSFFGRETPVELDFLQVEKL
jgi:transcriptional antiterminator NusG